MSEALRNDTSALDMAALESIVRVRLGQALIVVEDGPPGPIRDMAKGEVSAYEAVLSDIAHFRRSQ